MAPTLTHPTTETRLRQCDSLTRTVAASSNNGLVGRTGGMQGPWLANDTKQLKAINTTVPNSCLKCSQKKKKDSHPAAEPSAVRTLGTKTRPRCLCVTRRDHCWRLLERVVQARNRFMYCYNERYTPETLLCTPRTSVHNGTPGLPPSQEPVPQPDHKPVAPPKGGGGGGGGGRIPVTSLGVFYQSTRMCSGDTLHASGPQKAGQAPSRLPATLLCCIQCTSE